jgi:hypothetical protein
VLDREQHRQLSWRHPSDLQQGNLPGLADHAGAEQDEHQQYGGNQQQEREAEHDHPHDLGRDGRLEPVIGRGPDLTVGPPGVGLQGSGQCGGPVRIA